MLLFLLFNRHKNIAKNRYIFSGQQFGASGLHFIPCQKPAPVTIILSQKNVEKPKSVAFFQNNLFFQVFPGYQKNILWI